MLVGGAGCGKTVLVGEKLSQLDENYMVTNVPFNYYYTSEMLQVSMVTSYHFSFYFLFLLHLRWRLWKIIKESCVSDHT